MTPEEKKQFNDLLAWKKSLERSSTIPLLIDQSFTERFKSNLGISTHAGETQSVDEGGTDNYDVMLPADAFLQVVVNGTTYYVPVFT
jgi:hypothetical protein